MLPVRPTSERLFDHAEGIAVEAGPPRGTNVPRDIPTSERTPIVDVPIRIPCGTRIVTDDARIKRRRDCAIARILWCLCEEGAHRIELARIHQQVDFGRVGSGDEVVIVPAYDEVGRIERLDCVLGVSERLRRVEQTERRNRLNVRVGITRPDLPLPNTTVGERGRAVEVVALARDVEVGGALEQVLRREARRNGEQQQKHQRSLHWFFPFFLVVVKEQKRGTMPLLFNTYPNIF